MLGLGRGWYRPTDRSLSLPPLDAGKEEGLDTLEHGRNALTEFWIMGSDLQGSIDQHTAFVLPIREGAAQDLVENNARSEHRCSFQRNGRARFEK